MYATQLSNRLLRVSRNQRFVARSLRTSRGKKQDLFPRQQACFGRSLPNNVTSILPRSRALSTTSKPSSSKNDSNVFLDNLGTIFLSTIGLIILWLVRSFYNSQARNALRDSVENQAALDPIEISDLRAANSEFTPSEFKKIRNAVQHSFPHDVTYQQFVQCVRATMVESKGINFTIELGHLMDRVVEAALQKQSKSLESPMPMVFWLSTLSLALAGSPAERIQTLYEILLDGQEQQDTVSIDKVAEIVGYLQDTCQLAPDAQVVATSNQYPIQEYKVGTPDQLIDRKQWESSSGTSSVDMDAFMAILCSKSVCAWGECYHKKKFG